MPSVLKQILFQLIPLSDFSYREGPAHDIQFLTRVFLFARSGPDFCLFAVTQFIVSNSRLRLSTVDAAE